jgi:FolB domain-containing protein
MDRILIQDLLVRCIIGVNEDERRQKQDVVINLELRTDLGKAGKNDRFQDAVDYRGIKKQVMALAEASHFHLIEALAEAIAALCLKDERIREVQVRVDKPHALRFARSVAVQILRTRQA